LVFASLLAVFLLAISVLTAEARLEEIVVHSPALEGNLLGDSPDRNVTVYLPPGYDEDAAMRYPVLYLLHGFTGSNKIWMYLSINIESITDKLINQGTIEPMIIAMPDAHHKYRGTWYVNSPVTGNWEDFVTQELVAHIDNSYRTLSQSRSRGIAGHSMGGSEALRLAMEHPGFYSAAYGMSASPMEFNTAPDFHHTGDWIKVLALEQANQFDSAGLYGQAAIAAAASFSPNPDRLPFFVDFPFQLENGELEQVDSVWRKWLGHDPVAMVPTHQESLQKLRAIHFDCGTSDPVVVDSRAFAQALTAASIGFAYEEHDGDHLNRIAQRIEQKVLPLMSRALHGYLPQVRSATVDLGTILAGQSVPEITVVLAAPPEATGTYPELSLDLSSLGVSEALPMQHDGSGRYTARPAITPLRTGRHHLFVSMREGTDTPFPLSLLSLTVWPAGDLQVVADAVAEGWNIQGQLKVTLDPQATAQAYQGRSALAAQTNGLWKIVLSPPQPVSPLGYTALHFAFHPGEASGDVLDVAIATKRANLWPGKPGGAKVDLAAKSWQVVEIPLDGLGPYISIISIGFSGKLTGTFYVDDLRLVASAPPPPPPPTAVLEDHTASLPQRFALEQNYPNPFNSETVIRFALPASEKVELALYNLAGQKVATLAEGVREAGAYTLRWDGRDDSGRELGTGVYLYRLQAGEREEARKLLLLR
jgi:enterochelin esterase-like enzyme